MDFPTQEATVGRAEGKVVLITGAARGQGRSHAVRLAEEGADIIAIDICAPVDVVEYAPATPEDLAETALLVEKTGRRIVTFQVDIRDRVALDAAVKSGVDQLGKLDVVIANAGISPIGMNRPIEAFGDTLDINLSGTLNTVHSALPYLGEGSSVIVIGSIAALMPRVAGAGPSGPGGAAYSFAKLTLADYVNWLSLQLAPTNRRANIIHPTNTATEMFQNEATYRTFRPDLEHPVIEDVEGMFTSMHAMPISYIDPVDVSHAVVYLASDESRYVTGLQLKIDAGLLEKMGM
jgi:SDR family mycofactocin-dependent oxidoreductase